MYGAVASNLADKGRDEEIKVMSFIHGRALQLQYYIPGDIKLGDVIPDAPVGFANLVISANTLAEFKHLVPPPAATSQIASLAIGQFTDLLATGGCALNAKGAAHHGDGFLTYKGEEGEVGYKVIGFDVKDEQAKATTASTIGDEYLKILYSEVCRCDKMVSVRPRIGGKLGNHTFLLRVLQKLGDIDNDMLAAVKDGEIGVNSLFSSDLDDEGDGERATNYALLPPQHLPLTVADTEVTQTVQVNKMAVPYTSNFWLSDGHSIIPCYEYFYQNAASDIKDVLAAHRRDARRRVTKPCPNIFHL